MSLSYTYEYKWTLIRMNKKSNNYFQKQDIVWFWWFTWVDDFSQLYHREVGVQNVMISCCRARGPHILVISVWKRFGADHDSFHSGLNWKTTGMKDTFFPLCVGGGGTHGKVHQSLSARLMSSSMLKVHHNILV